MTSTFPYPAFPDALGFEPSEGRPTIACVGDSLTEGDYGGQPGVANVRKENYPLFLAEYLSCTTRNFGKCGYSRLAVFIGDKLKGLYPDTFA